jgi:hypothetical protein
LECGGKGAFGSRSPVLADFLHLRVVLLNELFRHG